LGVRGTEKAIETRVLVAHEDEYRTHREVIAAGIQMLRPHASVATCSLGELDRELGRFDPQVVVCGWPGAADPGDRTAWVQLPLVPGGPAKVRVGGRRRESPYLLLEGLLEIIDEAEELARKDAAVRTRGRGPS
jgi:hypothetical protein